MRPSVDALTSRKETLLFELLSAVRFLLFLVVAVAVAAADHEP